MFSGFITFWSGFFGGGGALVGDRSFPKGGGRRRGVLPLGGYWGVYVYFMFWPLFVAFIGMGSGGVCRRACGSHPHNGSSVPTLNSKTGHGGQ